ncbi:TPA: hypothetical protein DEP21_06460 [Patescibacteria group bacterium]|nr:hypothetical protein [Candidatus Gracilibacteria bacterium]
MNTFIIYAFDNDVIEFELVQDTSIPDQLPVCLFFFFIQGIYDHQSQVFLESHLLTNYYYVNAKIIPSKFIETHFSGKQLDSLRENIDKWEDKELTIIKLNNGEAHVTNAEEIEIYTVTSNPHIKLSQEMIN